MKIFALATLLVFNTNFAFATSQTDRTFEIKCLQMTGKNYGYARDLVLGCQNHKNKFANKCYKDLINSEAQFHNRMTQLCSFADNKLAVDIIEEYADTYSRLDKQIQLLLTHTHTQAEFDCLEDLLKLSKPDQSLIRKCIQASDNEIKIRNDEVFKNSDTFRDKIDKKFQEMMDWIGSNLG